MKQSTFFILVGVLSIVSLTSGIIGWACASAAEKKHGKASTFRDLLEDNAPDDIPDDFTDEFLRFY